MTQYKVGKSFSVDAKLIAEADELEINLNKMLEQALRHAIETQKAQNRVVKS